MAGVTNSVCLCYAKVPITTCAWCHIRLRHVRKYDCIIHMQVSRIYYCISWERIAAETQKDSSMSAVLNILKSPNDEKQEIKPELSEYAEYLDSLYVTGDVILYRDRAVIPSSLRKHVVDSLHATHQGVSTMEPRAQSSVFWPGVTRDIQQVRARCIDCNVIGVDAIGNHRLITHNPMAVFSKTSA